MSQIAQKNLKHQRQSSETIDPELIRRITRLQALYRGRKQRKRLNKVLQEYEEMMLKDFNFPVDHSTSKLSRYWINPSYDAKLEEYAAALEELKRLEEGGK